MLDVSKRLSVVSKNIGATRRNRVSSPVTRRPNPTDVLRADRERALRFAQGAGVGRVRMLLERARAELERSLPRADDETFSAARRRVTLEQIRMALNGLKSGMRSELAESGRIAAERQAEVTLRYLRDAEARFNGIVAPLPFDEAAMLDTAVRGAESSVLRRIGAEPEHRGRKGVLDRYGEATIGGFEEELQLSLVARKSWAETREALTKRSSFLQGAPARWAERIVRTELMAASNAASQQIISGAAESFGDTVKILSSVFDARTGADSLAVHGQIRRPSEPFDTWFGSVMHPPDRPNDRATVVPHRLSWPIPPELKPRGAGEIAARWAAEGRRASPPARPRLSTIPAREMASASVPRLGAVSDEDLDYLRDEGSFRESSFRAAREAMARARGEGATATEAALSFDPIRIDVDASGDKHLGDGRHRWAVARESRAKVIRARVVRYGARGAVKSDRIEVVRIRS